MFQVQFWHKTHCLASKEVYYWIFLKKLVTRKNYATKSRTKDGHLKKYLRKQKFCNQGDLQKGPAH
jgi:hypothetical protein